MTGKTTPPSWSVSFLDPALLTLLGCFQLFHLHPGIWWGDGPELMTAAYCGGIAHPTGYPLYLALLDLFSGLPLGSLAWRGNLFSMASTLAAFALLFRMRPLESAPTPEALGWRFGLSATALSPALWGPTLTAEVYSLSFLHLALSVYLGGRFLERPTLGRLLWVGLAVGLGVGHHRLLALLVPGLALWLAPAFHGSPRRAFWLAPAAVLFVLGTFGPYVLLYFRALGDPPLNWQDPSTLENLWKVFSAEQFRMDQKVMQLKRWVAYSAGMGPTPFQLSQADLMNTPHRLLHHYGFGLALAAAGAAWLVRTNPRLLVSGAVAWILPTLFVVQYHVGDRETFHLLPSIVVGLLVAYGWSETVGTAWTRFRAGLIFLVALGVMQTLGQAGKLESPPEEVALAPDRYARRILDRIPPGGVLFVASEGADVPADHHYFPILYHREVAQRNPSTALLSEGYFTSPWYRGTLERQGISAEFFDRLESGDDRVEVRVTDFKTYIRDDLPDLLSPSKEPPREPVHRIYLVEGRPYFLNRETLAILAAEHLFPHLLKRPLYSTARFTAVNPYLEKKIAWRPEHRIEIDAARYAPLRGEPLPTGHLYRAVVEDAPETP